MKLYKTLTRNTDPLTTLAPHIVKLYTCGLTVYSQPHIGNWVGYIYWDVLVRTLQASGYQVERTQNYTDVGHLVSDDDSGEDRNARITYKLFQGRSYFVRLRLYYPGISGRMSLMYS